MSNFKNETEELHNGACGFYKFLNIESHYHEQIEMIYVDKGCLSMTVNLMNFNLQENDFILINSYDIHSFSQEERGNIFICPIFPTSFSIKLSTLKVFKTVFKDKSKDVKNILSMYNIFHNLSTDFRKLYFNMLFEMLIVLNKKHLGAIIPASNSMSTIIMEYIDSHFLEQINLNEVAKSCCTNKTYVTKAVKIHSGLSFLSYVNKLRVWHFVEIHKYSPDYLKTANAIFKSGFSSARTFYRIFRNEFNMTPKEYFSTQQVL